MSLPWSAQQGEWLQALGHPLLVLAGAPAAGVAVAVADHALPVTSTSGARPAREHDDALYRALLRATGHPPVDAGRVLRQLAVDPAALRGNPSAKRALWPRLRHLRAGRSR